MRNLTSRSFAIILVLAVAFGCTSTEERYATAEQLADQGLYQEATGEYIRVLEKDENFPGARIGLAEAGGILVEEYVSYARESADREQFAEASETLDLADRIRSRARGVRVNIPVPEDYGRFRMSVDRSAVEELTLLAKSQKERGNFGMAIESYDRARRFARETEQQSNVDEAQAETYLAWGEADMEKAHYRAASGRFDSAIRLMSEHHPIGDQAFELRETAFELGTVTAAFLPMFVVENGGAAPPRFAADLEDALVFDYWSQPPLFIHTVDAGDQRRIMRREGIGRIPPTVRLISQLGDLMDADLLVVAELSDFVAVEKDVKEVRHSAKMSGTGRRPVVQDTAFSEVTSTLEMTAELIYSVTNPHTRSVVDEGTLAWTAGGPIHYGDFPGNWKQLTLSRADRELFDKGALQDQRRIIEEILVDELAATFAERVFGSILYTIP